MLIKDGAEIDLREKIKEKGKSCAMHYAHWNVAQLGLQITKSLRSSYVLISHWLSAPSVVTYKSVAISSNW